MVHSPGDHVNEAVAALKKGKELQEEAQTVEPSEKYLESIAASLISIAENLDKSTGEGGGISVNKD